MEKNNHIHTIGALPLPFPFDDRQDIPRLNFPPNLSRLGLTILLIASSLAKRLHHVIMHHLMQSFPLSTLYIRLSPKDPMVFLGFRDASLSHIPPKAFLVGLTKAPQMMYFTKRPKEACHTTKYRTAVLQVVLFDLFSQPGRSCIPSSHKLQLQ